jgi:hypothetical protein
MMRSPVPGKVSCAVETLMRQPVDSLIELMVCPPLPITVPADLLPTSILIAVAATSPGSDCRLF